MLLSVVGDHPQNVNGGKVASSSLHSHHLEDTVDSLGTFSFVGVLEGLIQFVGGGGMKLKGKPEFGCGGRYI